MPITRESRLYVFKVKGRWYWWLVASNGRALACCAAQGFTRRNNAISAALEVVGKYTIVLTMPPGAGTEHQLFQYHNKSLGELLLAAQQRK